MMKVSDLTEDEEKIIMSAKRYAKDHYDTEAYRKIASLLKIIERLQTSKD